MVTNVGIDRKLVCDFLLVININPHSISYSYRTLSFKFWTKAGAGHFAFLSPLGGLGNYIVHLRLIGKLVVDFLFVFIELFLLFVTAEAV